ncbi:metal ABC transporter permease [Tabrizicola sp. M-4]|uniref:metal ABC transporter permease n=1 Tax=Tabrizicola sp. M-4 TaxID=3055847 RepID=UPI003DA7FED6
MTDAFLSALFLQAGYNATLVSIGAALLGLAAGSVGAFLTLRRRALASDAMAHATLPGIGLAFLVMAALGGDGRNLAGLLLGAGLTAALGLFLLQRLTTRTRLPEDAAIGAVLSTFYGAGIVLLTVIQNLSFGRPAGLEGFLLGSTAGMLLSDALLIAGGGAVILLILALLRRPLAMTAFDPDHARQMGVNTRATDTALLLLTLACVLLGLRVVGLILIVALLITPALTARLWSDRIGIVALLAGGIGAVAGHLGASLSLALPDLPTGPSIVLLVFAAFLGSLLLAPGKGLFSRHRRTAPDSA